jgi:hypothetical protein
MHDLVDVYRRRIPFSDDFYCMMDGKEIPANFGTDSNDMFGMQEAAFAYL